MSYAQKLHQGIDPLRSMANGGGGSSGGSSTTVQSIPAELKPLATAYTNKAIELGNQSYTPYMGQRYAGFTNPQYQGMGMVADRALNGSQTVNNAENSLNQMISGQQNPYLDANVNRALDAVQGRVNSQFGGSNYGTTANQETLARSLGDTAASMYGNAYESDANRRLSAIGQAQTFGNQAYQDASQLMGIGQQMQDQLQNQYDFNYQQFQEQQNLPYKHLAAQSGVFGSNLGATSTTQQSSGGK